MGRNCSARSLIGVSNFAATVMVRASGGPCVASSNRCEVCATCGTRQLLEPEIRFGTSCELKIESSLLRPTELLTPTDRD
jgi:hypothetical protein